jgi:hypothetical protein
MKSPTFVNADQAARDIFQVSLRKFQQLRDSGLIPPPLELGSRCLRWSRDELIATVQRLAPRQTAKLEPSQLAQARAERKVAKGAE